MIIIYDHCETAIVRFLLWLSLIYPSTTITKHNCRLANEFSIQCPKHYHHFSIEIQYFWIFSSTDLPIHDRMIKQTAHTDLLVIHIHHVYTRSFTNEMCASLYTNASFLTPFFSLSFESYCATYLYRRTCHLIVIRLLNVQIGIDWLQAKQSFSTFFSDWNNWEIRARNKIILL